MSEFKNAVDVLINSGAKFARAINLNNSAGRRWTVYVDGIRGFVQNNQLVIIRYADGDGFGGERRVSVKKYAQVLSDAGFECEIKNNVLYVNSKIGE